MTDFNGMTQDWRWSAKRPNKRAKLGKPFMAKNACLSLTSFLSRDLVISPKDLSKMATELSGHDPLP